MVPLNRIGIVLNYSLITISLIKKMETGWGLEINFKQMENKKALNKNVKSLDITGTEGET